MKWNEKLITTKLTDLANTFTPVRMPSNSEVIPANMVTGQVQIEMGLNSQKYSYYKDAFYLIYDAVNFYKSLVIPF